MLTEQFALTARDAVDLAETLGAAEEHFSRTGDIGGALAAIRAARTELYLAARISPPWRKDGAR